ncbi:MAG: hypothetical protein A2Y62_14755 [Candidatus Fischerbacteria bacterium RBG_13_37_8]|uniref:AAA+ ATPase domain-containing protein n=1 Tax=Candidatus Fischerbacteria bacterium RBG_13_37_8 TaxID=1817863 RepID=A0A1F5VMT1_9BACT|nr:MAG: hypothetical protein A2Y62_14755 [Candidatus Fischerbacteria bacterium RBG_13_37_8]
MLDVDVRPLLYNQNPWWTYSNYLIPEAVYPHRDAYPEIKNQTHLNPITAVVGLRRTGKTTLLKQLIAELLTTSHVPAKAILFFSFDQLLVNRNTELLSGIIDAFLDRIIGRKIWELDSPVYIFLDELQYVLDWQTILKRYYDQTKKIKFFLSGSASLYVKEKSKESLAGRMLTVNLGVLNFREYLRLGNAGIEIPDCSLEMCDIKGIAEVQAAYAGKIDGLFENFLIKGQFPEVITEGLSDEHAGQYIMDSVLTKILEIDIPLYFNIKGSEEIKSLFRIAAVETGNVIEYGTIARDVGISRNTVAQYYSWLEKAFLISMLYNFTKSVRKQVRTMKKCYSASTNFSALASVPVPSAVIPTDALGHYAETYVHNILSSRYPALHFIRRRDKEVDFIVPSSSGYLPIEVKYSRRVDSRELKNLKHFMNYFQAKRAIVLTRNIAGHIEHGGFKICLIPVWAL